jgi:hypothetical protein
MPTRTAAVPATQELVPDWIVDELAALDLGDVRLDRRCHRVLHRLFSKPSLSIPAACHGWAEVTATYRFFDNFRVDDFELLRPHRLATIERMRQHPVVLAIQDTTEFDYTRPEETVIGAGPLTYETQSGFHNHVQLVVTPQRLPLGVIDAEIWGRDPLEFGKRRRRQEKRGKRIEEKESFRWLQGYRQACAVAEELPATQVVSIADAEGDIYEYFLDSVPEAGQRKADWIVRACQDRRVLHVDSKARKLWAAVEKTPTLGTVELEVAKKEKRQKRTAILTVQSATVQLQPPERPGGRPAPVTVNVVLLREVDPPAGEDAIEWLLLTSLPVATFAEALRVTEYYACRWQIEIFFKILKSGCRVEKLQLETEDRLKPCLVLYMIIAWRVLYLTMLGRDCPELPCNALFTDEEWKAVWTIVKRKPTPTTPPTLAEFLQLVARLGGHLGRKRDGAPGPQTMWIGLQRTVDFAIAWQTFGPEAAKACFTGPEG